MDKSKRNQAAYAVSGKRTIAKVNGLQAVLFTMAAGESTPWHRHSRVTDTFFCLAGPLEVQLRDSGETLVLACGETCEVTPGRVHRAVNPGSAEVRYLLLQGVGEYDFIAVAQGDS